MSDKHDTTVTIVRPDNGETTMPLEEMTEVAEGLAPRARDQRYAIANLGDVLTARSSALSAFENLSEALQVPADHEYGRYDRLDQAYACVLRALDDLGSTKTMLRKVRDGYVSSANFDQLDMQFAPSR